MSPLPDWAPGTAREGQGMKHLEARAEVSLEAHRNGCFPSPRRPRAGSSVHMLTNTLSPQPPLLLSTTSCSWCPVV